MLDPLVPEAGLDSRGYEIAVPMGVHDAILVVADEVVDVVEDEAVFEATATGALGADAVLVGVVDDCVTVVS